MDLVIRAAVVYLFVFAILRASGKRQFSDLTTFDFILLLIISEAVSNALNGGDDFSITGAVILVSTLVGIDILVSLARQRSQAVEAVIESMPVLLIDHGRPLEQNLKAERVDIYDVLASARQNYGIESLEKVRYAILERDGKISILAEADDAQDPTEADPSIVR